MERTVEKQFDSYMNVVQGSNNVTKYIGHRQAKSSNKRYRSYYTSYIWVFVLWVFLKKDTFLSKRLDPDQNAPEQSDMVYHCP